MIEYEYTIPVVNAERLDAELRKAYGEKLQGVRTASNKDGARLWVELDDDCDPDLAAMICANHDGLPTADPDLEWLENYTPGKRYNDSEFVSTQDFMILLDIVKRRLK